MYRKNISGWLKHADFIMIDLLCIQVAFYLSYVITQRDFCPYNNPLYLNMSLFVEIADFIAIFFFEFYKNVLKRGYYKEFAISIKQSIIILLIVSLYLFVIQEGESYSRLALFLMIFLYAILNCISCLLLKKYIYSRMDKGGRRSLYIVATSDLAYDSVKNIKEKNYEMFKINGLVILDKDMVGEKIHGIKVIANHDTAADYLCTEWVDEIFVNLNEEFPYPKKLIDDCTRMGLTIHFNLAKLSDNDGEKQIIQKVGAYTVLTTSVNVINIKQAFLKRMLDICFGLAGCFITVIIFIFVAPIIYIKSPGPIFFSQERVGENGKTFKMYKFRSMYMDAEERKKELMKDNKVGSGLMFKLDFDPRIIGNRILPDGTKKTGIGQFIRSTSLDEFPQFWNVLKGDMSVVGFRPALPSEYELYHYHHRVRISMKPGITGMWQVSGRSDITDFEEVVKLDAEYIRNWNIGLDFKILFKTIKAVLKKDGSM